MELRRIQNTYSGVYYVVVRQPAWWRWQMTTHKRGLQDQHHAFFLTLHKSSRFTYCPAFNFTVPLFTSANKQEICRTDMRRRTLHAARLQGTCNLTRISLKEKERKGKEKQNMRLTTTVITQKERKKRGK